MASPTSWLHATKTSILPPMLSGPPRRMASRKSVCVPRADLKDSSSVETTEPELESPAPAASSSPTTTTNSEFKGGPFTVRSDQIGAVLGSSLNVPFRLGSGAIVKGYKIENYPAAQIGEDKYAILVAGLSHVRREQTVRIQIQTENFTVSGIRAFYSRISPPNGRKFVEVANPGPRPEKPIEIYEFEGCPFCRKVREIVSILDIDVLFYPCPKDGPNFRPKANEMGGKKQFPYMVDPNTGTAMYESDDIIKYLVDKYGDGKVPIMLNLGILTTITAGLALIARGGKGSTYVPSKLPEKPLELWAYESSPFCKIAREALSELELPHIYHSCARGSAKRDILKQKTGRFQVPYLEDPNTGAKMFESADIVEYVRKTYAIGQA